MSERTKHYWTIKHQTPANLSSVDGLPFPWNSNHLLSGKLHSSIPVHFSHLLISNLTTSNSCVFLEPHPKNLPNRICVRACNNSFCITSAVMSDCCLHQSLKKLRGVFTVKKKNCVVMNNVSCELYKKVQLER
ncbi:hypothetical protein ILYODFUR_028346 [Ilyodon furcidens]|uniref:Uncharacterized protein n=1 Tax=Ilyodon furcidens TaxID=33524 RepID=A0ABV0UYX1_9TELE